MPAGGYHCPYCNGRSEDGWWTRPQLAHIEALAENYGEYWTSNLPADEDYLLGMNKNGQPRFRGRFDSTITDIEIYDVVSAVALHGKPEKPEAITVRAWNAARAGAGWPEAPTAHALCMRLGRGWRMILHDALSPHRDHAQVEATRKQSDERSDLDYRHVRFAIRMVATARGQDTLTPDDYMETREKIITTDRRRAAGGVLERLLPTANQIRWVMGNDEGAWQRAVVDVAGLRALRSRGRGPAKGMPILDAYVLYVKVADCRVAKSELIRFAAESGFKIAKREPGKPWSEYEREVAERLAELGLAFPTKRLRKQAERPVADPVLIPNEYRRYDEAPVSDEDAIRALREYHGLLPAQTTRSQARYRQMVKQHPHWPWPQHFNKWGGFAALMQAAVALGPIEIEAPADAETPKTRAA